MDILRDHQDALNKYRVESIYRALRFLRLTYTRTDETRTRGHGFTEGVRITNEGGGIVRMRLVFVKDDAYACWDDYDVAGADFELLMGDILRSLTDR